jgi:hypothetical protein
MRALTTAVWRKSSHSGQDGQCVELADLGDAVGIRDSKNPTGPALIFNRRQVRALADRIRSEA